MSIEVRGISKAFGSKQVLRHIDFTFETGKVNMIIGASGSGKTVLLKCMVGLIMPDEGRVLYDGVDFYSKSVNDLRELRKKIGMLFQGAALFDSMTVGENVAFPLKMFSTLTKGEIAKRVAYVLDRVNLHNVEKLFPAEISGGMKKRVGIARAISLQPSFLFCDEPNSGLDPQTADVIDKLIHDITEDLKITSVIVSHDMKSVLSIADKVLFIFKGAKEWEGTRDDITTATNPVLTKFIEISGIALDFVPEPSE
jgi:phospholipid/cholesterol/gamma-HCH transport system ATP-binding protein